MSRFDDDEPEDTSDREVSAALTVGEGDIDASLRPRSLREFIGQARVRAEQLAEPDDGRERVAQLVRDAGRHPRERLELLGADLFVGERRDPVLNLG